MLSMISNTKRLVMVRETRSPSMLGKLCDSRGLNYAFFIHKKYIIRTPDTSKIRQKMVYASSKEAIRRKLVGIAIEIQGTDASEVSLHMHSYHYIFHQHNSLYACLGRL